MKNKLRNTFFLLALLLLLEIIFIAPVLAGDPDWTVGAPDPTHLVCINERTNNVVNLPSDAVDDVTGNYDPDATVDPEQLKRDCQQLEDDLRDSGYDYTLYVGYAHQSRIDGYVFEFHPDPNAPGGWAAVRSRDVPVVASGPGFEVFWGSEKDGSYFFKDLGAGPVTLNLRLPPDAHPINPNITVVTTSFPDDEWNIDLAFYRGNYPPPNVDELVLPADHPRSKLLPGDTIAEIDEETGQITYMPNVGGIPPLEQPTVTIVLASLLLIILPTAGILTARRKHMQA